VEFSETQFDQILEQVELAGITDEFLDLTAGFNLKVSKTGTKFTTKYTFTFDRKPTAIDSSVLDTLVDIDAYVRSKFTDTDRAINALKSITQGTPIQPKALNYSGNDDVVDGNYNDVPDLDDTAVDRIIMDDAAIDKLFEE